MPQKAELRFDGRVIPLDIIEGSEGERAIDIRKLRDETGLITLDPGYAQHRLVRERDHVHRRREGHPALPRLRHRGAGRALQLRRGRATCLIQGELPNAARSSTRSASRSRYHSMLHEDFRQFYRVLPKDAHPMAACSAVVGALATFYPDSLDPRIARAGRGLRPSADRQAADDRGLRVQALDRPAVHVPRQPALLRREHPAPACSRRRASPTRWIRSSRRRSICC